MPNFINSKLLRFKKDPAITEEQRRTAVLKTRLFALGYDQREEAEKIIIQIAQILSGEESGGELHDFQHKKFHKEYIKLLNEWELKNKSIFSSDNEIKKAS